eukprot:TRINITY_DN37496_c0_g2_i1.p1 TRINITY_DN37496_c0_g2~~TRINITY_DN37496_c0_g2_i1.p1  ORF type:complete len:443 (-),score=67.89 TRINITY_DN37496_c0_g2_i1:21-1349(-)
MAEGGSGRALYSHLPTDVRNEWYAVALAADVPSCLPGKVGLSALQPMATSLLGDPIVLWRDSGAAIRCVADKCPHRSAPLSLGRINGATGNIECIYHGWQMEGKSGQVTHIPALLDDKKVPPNAKVQTYPTIEQDGVVYVWPGAAADAASADPPARDTTDDGEPLAVKSSGFVCQQLCLDLPIEHALMVENLLDPAHIPFAHEGTIGRRSMAEKLEMSVTKTRRGIRGSVKEGYYNGFEAPCNIVLHTPPKPGKMDMYQFVACTPTAPGHMRMVYRAYRNFATWVDRIPLLKRVFDGFSLKIIFQDYNLLLGQQQRLREGALAWNSTIQVDVLPLTYRRFWQKTFGNMSKEGPWWRGWDGSLDVEELHKLRAYDKDFDCNGCAIPKLPHHPQNVLEVSGAPANPLRPQVPQTSWQRWAPSLTSAALLGAAMLFYCRSQRPLK